MSIRKTIHIQGISTISFENAVNTALLETSKSIDNIDKLLINNLCCKVKDNKISEYVADIDVIFTVDLERINK